MSCTCEELTTVEWTEFPNEQPYFVRGCRHESFCPDATEGWTFEGRGAFDVCYQREARGSTDARRQRATLHACLVAKPWGPLFKEVLHAMHWVRGWIQDNATKDPARAFEPIRIVGRQKEVRTIDLVAECLLISRLSERLASYGAVIIGEESLRDPETDLSSVDSPVILVDAVDGTKQLERDVHGHWCSAAVVFHPPTHAILASFVVLPDGWVVFKVGAQAAKCRFMYGRLDIVALAGPSTVTTLDQAAISFYGQKKEYLHANGALAVRLDPFLIWPGGGNPAIVRLVDRRTVDAVYELRGQWPHDVVPALAIAEACGVTLMTLQGEPLDLYRALCRPGHPQSRLCYIAASTPELAAAIAHEATASSSVGSLAVADLHRFAAAS